MRPQLLLDDRTPRKILSSVTPSTAAGGNGISQWIDVVGYSWIEFQVLLTTRSAVTKLAANVHFAYPGPEALKGLYEIVRVDSPDSTSGLAPQVAWEPSKAGLSGATASWFLPVPRMGSWMRLDVWASTGSPGTDKVSAYVVRRNGGC